MNPLLDRGTGVSAGAGQHLEAFFTELTVLIWLAVTRVSGDRVEIGQRVWLDILRARVVSQGKVKPVVKQGRELARVERLS